MLFWYAPSCRENHFGHVRLRFLIVQYCVYHLFDTRLPNRSPPVTKNLFYVLLHVQDDPPVLRTRTTIIVEDGIPHTPTHTLKPKQKISGKTHTSEVIYALPVLLCCVENNNTICHHHNLSHHVTNSNNNSEASQIPHAPSKPSFDCIAFGSKSRSNPLLL